MNIDQFVDTWNNSFCDIDKEYGNQCWDIVEQYAEDVLQIPRSPWAITLNAPQGQVSGVAKNAWLYYDLNPQLVKYFDRVSPGQEKKGDINVYDGHGAFTEGHIAIELGGQVFEQNADPDHSPAHIAVRPRTYLLGSLRKKGTDMNMTAQECSDAYKKYANLSIAPSNPACQNRQRAEFFEGLCGSLADGKHLDAQECSDAYKNYAGLNVPPADSSCQDRFRGEFYKGLAAQIAGDDASNGLSCTADERAMLDAMGRLYK